MRVLTWLPRDLRQGLTALDPAHGGDAVPRPDLAELLNRAQDDDEWTIDPPDESAGGDQVPKTPLRPRRTALAAAAVIVVVAAIAAGLATYLTGTHPAPPVTNTGRLRGVTWLQPLTRATVVFQAHTAHLSDGCSGATQRLRVRGGRLHLGSQVGKSYVCSPPPPPRPGMPDYPQYRREQIALTRFYRVLHSAPTWTITGTTLTLTAPDGIAVRLTDQGTAQLSLPGTRWDLQAVDSPVISGRPTFNGGYTGTLSFDERGKFHASEPCERLSGNVAVTGPRVTFHITHYIPLACPAISTSGMSNTVHHVLSSTATWQVEDNQLRLITPDRAELIYRPAPH